MGKHAALAVVMLVGVAEAKDPPDAAAIKKLIAAEAKALTSMGFETAGVYAGGFQVAGLDRVTNEADQVTSTIINAPYLTDLKPSGIRLGLSRDGQSAWVTYSAATQTACDSCEATPGPTLRASELVVKVGGKWQVQAALWSEGVADAKVNKAGKGGKLSALDAVVDSSTGDASVRDAFTALVAKGFDPAVAESKELIGIGSAPKEMTVGGKGLVPFINKKWVGNMVVKGPVLAVMAPSGTTAAVIANVDLTKVDGKASYAVPFRWFVVFDKDAAGVWTPVHVHFAVAPIM
jgi:hypothetical protein